MSNPFEEHKVSTSDTVAGAVGIPREATHIPRPKGQKQEGSGDQKQTQSSNTENQNSNQETHVPPAAKTAAAGDAKVPPPAPIPAGQSQEAALTPREIPKGNLPPSPLPCSDKTAPR